LKRITDERAERRDEMKYKYCPILKSKKKMKIKANEEG
jgi:hypothetical protein